MRISIEKNNHWLHNLENRNADNPYTVSELVSFSGKTESNVKKLMHKYAKNIIFTYNTQEVKDNNFNFNKLNIKKRVTICFEWDKELFIYKLDKFKNNLPFDLLEYEKYLKNKK